MSSISSMNPATGEKIGEVPVYSEGEVKMAVHRARAVQPAWNTLGYKGRGQIIIKARDIILRNIDALSELISKENGKPVIEALSHDVMPVMDLMTFFSKKTEQILKKEKVRLGKWAMMGHRSYLEYYPYGVIGIISPWNFPFSIPMGEIVIALMVGNAVVLKPSEYTPFIGLKIQEIFKEAGLPRDVFQVITGDGLTGKYLVNSGVDKIIFTGSVATGKKIMAEASQRLTPVTLELGGKDPMIILNDADLDTASSAAVWGAFCNSGQVCASIERVYVHQSIAQEFTQLVVEKTKKLRQGFGLSGNVEIGSMTAGMQLDLIESQINDAKQRGAQILLGGERNHDLPGLFFKPTILSGVDHSFAIVQEETFGPVLPIMTFQTDQEAIDLANDSRYALNAYIWTSNLERGQRVATQIVAGTVNINESVLSYTIPQTPWGGPKESGIGKTHGVHGLMDLVRIRHIHVNKKSSQKNFWWYGYSEEKFEMMRAMCFMFFGRGFKRIKNLFRFLKLFRKIKMI